MIDLRIIAALVIIAVAAIGGWSARGWKEDAARLAAEREQHATYIKTVEGWAAGMQEINAQREQDHQQAAADRREWQRRLKDVHTTGAALASCDGRGSGTGLDPDRYRHPDNHLRLTAAFVGLLNHAHCIGLPEALRTSGRDGECAAASATPAR